MQIPSIKKEKRFFLLMAVSAFQRLDAGASPA
jgi:hypothetical protein